MFQGNVPTTFSVGPFSLESGSGGVVCSAGVAGHIRSGIALISALWRVLQYEGLLGVTAR
jgi:hypothetical protein